MNGFLTKAGLGVALAATTLTVAAPAEAQRRWHRDRGGDTAAAAIIGGVVGLGLGAAIASSNNRDRYYDRGYYADRGYYNRNYHPRYRHNDRRVYRDRYYAPPRAYYRDYYGPRGYYGW